MSDQETIVAEETTENAAEIAVEEQAPEPVSEASESPNGSSTPASLENQESVSEAVPADDSSDEDDSVSIHNLKPGQKLVGTVKNITSFGAFVNIGLAQDGLVHISELSKQKVENVTDVVSTGLQVDIWVKKVDKKRGRISLTMVKPVTRKFKNIQEDDELVGTVTRLEPYGAFIDIDSDREGLVHISQVTHDYIKHPEEALTIGDTVNVKVLKVNRKKRQVDLSIKALLAPPAPTEAQIFEKQQTAKENIVPEEDEEPTPTAMALAFASFQVEQQPEETRVKEKSVKKKSKEMDAIVARTLATQDI